MLPFHLIQSHQCSYVPLFQGEDVYQACRLVVSMEGACKCERHQELSGIRAEGLACNKSHSACQNYVNALNVGQFLTEQRKATYVVCDIDWCTACSTDSLNPLL